MVLRQQQRPGEQDEAIKGGGEVAGAGTADLVRGCGKDGGVRVDEERLCLRLPSNKCDGEPKLLCTTSFATHVLLII